MKKRLTPAETLAKYKPVLDLMNVEGISAPDACDKVGIKYAAFISWKRRYDTHQAAQPKEDGRKTRWQTQGKELEEPKAKVFRKKSTPQLVTIPIAEPKKTSMTVLIGESADIFKALQMINEGKS
jgi:transposase